MATDPFTKAFLAFAAAWLVPHLWAMLLGVTLAILHRDRYRLSLRVSLVLMAVVALLFVGSRVLMEPVLNFVTPYGLFLSWWDSGTYLTGPLTVVMSVVYCRRFCAKFVDARTTKTEEGSTVP